MARKMILVSDLSGRQMDDREQSVRITITFGDRSLPQYVLDAHPDDPELKKLLERGTQQPRRGRRPKSQV